MTLIMAWGKGMVMDINLLRCRKEKRLGQKTSC
jgi:hypothetical protein